MHAPLCAHIHIHTLDTGHYTLLHTHTYTTQFTTYTTQYTLLHAQVHTQRAKEAMKAVC